MQTCSMEGSLLSVMLLKSIKNVDKLLYVYRLHTQAGVKHAVKISVSVNSDCEWETPNCLDH